MIACAAVTASLLHASTASAGPVRCVGAPAPAEELFRRGRLEQKQGNYALARACFAESYELSAAVGALLNLAICDAELGDLLAAERAFRKVLEKLSEDDPRRPIAEDHLARVDLRIPRLTLRLAEEAPPEVSVSCDGEVLRAAELGQPLKLGVGQHVVVVSARGRTTTRYELTLREGEQRTLRIAPPLERTPEPPEQVSPPGPHELRVREPSRSAQTLKVAAGAAGALALAGFGASGYFALEALARKRDADADCDGDRCGDAGLADRRAAVRLGNTATGFLVAGAALAVTGGTLFFVGHSRSQRAAVGVSLVVQPGIGGGSIRGSFLLP